MDAPVTVFDCKWASQACLCQDTDVGAMGLSSHRAAGQLPPMPPAVPQ